MTRSAARTKNRSALRPTGIGVVVLAAAIIAALVYQSVTPSTPAFSEVPRGANPATPAGGPATHDDRPATQDDSPATQDDGAATQADGAVTEDDGVLPDGVTVFDDHYPGVANLDGDLLRALRDAATDAGRDGIEFSVNSGWRSPEYQNQLLREAVAKYGSESEAARWVATADTSPHVAGEAVDVGPTDALAWLSDHGAAYGLCQIYRNEPWHYELRPEAITHRCPRRYADPTQDPRMQR